MPEQAGGIGTEGLSGSARISLSAGQEPGEFRCGHGLAEKAALRFGALEPHEARPLVFVLDVFGDDLGLQSLQVVIVDLDGLECGDFLERWLLFDEIVRDFAFARGREDACIVDRAAAELSGNGRASAM